MICPRVVMIQPTVFTSTVLGVVLASAAAAAAQPPPHEHAGFYLRVYLGPAYFKASDDDPLLQVTLAGSGAVFGLAAGHTVGRNLVVFGELFNDVATGPTLTLNGQTSLGAQDGSTGVVGVGAGAAYYVMPANVYLSGTLSFSQLSSQDDAGGQTDLSDTGPGLSLMVGKEWWVARKVGLGVAGQVFFGSQPDHDGADVRWSTSAFALAVSGTYN